MLEVGKEMDKMSNRNPTNDRLYRLCYANKNILYFTDNFGNQWGDDWDDAPYEHNAGEPYEWIDEWSEKENLKSRGHIRMIAFLADQWLEYPKDGYYNSPYSVDDINNGAIAWIRVHGGKPLPAGTTIDKAMVWLAKIGARWGELK